MSNKEIIEELYTNKNSLYHKLFFGLFKYDKGIEAFIEKNIKLKSGQKVLDAGCGSGVLTKNLFEAGKKQGIANLSFYAFDLTNAMLELFRGWITANNAEGVTLCQADVLKMNELPDAWNDFDLIVTSAMLEYLDKGEIGPAISNLKSRLAKDGRLVLIITKKNILTRYLIEKWWKSNSYERTEIIDILKTAGFKQIKEHVFPVKYSYLNIWGLIFEAD